MQVSKIEELTMQEIEQVNGGGGSCSVKVKSSGGEASAEVMCEIEF